MGRIVLMALLPLLLPVTGCFTGIESTPRINADDAGREITRTTSEEAYLADIGNEPFARWIPGKQWVVTDSKLSILLAGDGDALPPAVGDTLSYVGCVEVPSVTGGGAVDLRLAGHGGAEYLYRVNAPAAELASRRRVDIPFTVEMSVIDSVAARLDGRTLYTRTSLWYDSIGESVSGRRFVPVTVTDVTVGNTVCPVRVRFTDADAPARSYFLYLAIGEGAAASRTFPAQFYFDNPRARYPSMSDTVWDNIVNSRVTEGMTREECRLALGAPSDIKRRYGRDRLGELWSYPDGSYLLFEDGLLWEFRR